MPRRARGALALAGDHPPYLEQIFQEAEYDEADRAVVRYLGFVSDGDLVVLYNLALCLAFPSRNEGFGLPITEAMACGCPVAASSATALPEVCGGAAILVDPTDAVAWTDALATIVGDGGPAQPASPKGPGAGRRAELAEDGREILSFVA